jgi:cytochrome P450
MRAGGDDVTRWDRLVTDLGRGADGDNDPYQTLAWLRSCEPVARVPGPRGEGWVWLVTSYDLAQQCLTDGRLSFRPHDQAGSGQFLAVDPPEHTRQRRLVAAMFGARQTERLRPHVTAVCEALVDDFAGQGQVDLMAQYASLIPEAVAYEVFGVPEEHRLPRGRATELTMRIALAEGEAGGPATDELLAYARHLVTYRQRCPGDGMAADLVLSFGGGGPQFQAALVDAMYLLFGTGQLSTAPFLGAAMLRAVEHDGRPRDRHGWRAVVEEALRLDAALQTAMPRYALTDIEIGGQRIGRADVVLVSLAGANRDEARFTKPDTFEPSRENRAHLAFGHGIHYCLGAPLARLEGEVALEVMFRRLAPLRLLDAKPTWALGPMLRCPRRVVARFGAEPA